MSFLQIGTSLRYFSILLILLTNCGPSGDTKSRTYSLESNIDIGIRIRFFKFGRVREERIVGRGVIFQGTAIDDGIRGALNPNEALSADSIVVFFEETRQQIYYGEEGVGFHATPQTERNILMNEAYTIINDGLYEFIFTEQDYENAEPIGG